MLKIFNNTIKYKMAEFLGKYAQDYEEVLEIAETKLGKIYQAYNIKQKRQCYLKSFEKKKLEQGDYDFLMQKVRNEEEITKLCKCQNVVEFYQKLEIDDTIFFELEYCEKDIYNAIIKIFCKYLINLITLIFFYFIYIII